MWVYILNYNYFIAEQSSCFFPDMNEAQAEHILNSCKFENVTEMFINQIIKLKTLLEFLCAYVYYFPKVYNISKEKKLLLIVGNII